MHLSRTADCVPEQLVADGSVLTIGAFDGLHLGHQRILDRVLAEASQRRVPAAVMSFEPTPKEFFAAASPPARLMRFREKFEALAEYGLDLFFCPRFDARMQGVSVPQFVEHLLVNTLKVSHLVVGDDFRFGKARTGGVDDLKLAGQKFGFTVEQVGSVINDGERVSSSAVRHALAAGELTRATRFLGRRYRMSGRVVEGNHLGRELGYPTANVALRRRQTPVMGIFAVRVWGLGDTVLDGVASVGIRPTVGGTKPLLEVHIFDFDEDIYGRYIQVEFVAKLRDEVKFPDLEELTEQMHRDAAQARDILAA